MKKLEILGVRLDNLSQEELVDKFREFLNGKSFNHIATVNPEFLVEANKNTKFRGILQKTALNICDGVGISIISRIFFQLNLNRITGVEVAEILCKICEQEGKLIYFLGGFGVAKQASEEMFKKYPKLKIAGTEDGNPAKISEQLLIAEPDAILVAFGAPKQEYWLADLAKKIPSLRLGIGIGGTFDFWLGKTKRAPAFCRKIGLEWLWRLILEPRIRGKRIWRAVVVFPYLFLKSFFKK